MSYQVEDPNDPLKSIPGAFSTDYYDQGDPIIAYRQEGDGFQVLGQSMQVGKMNRLTSKHIAKQGLVQEGDATVHSDGTQDRTVFEADDAIGANPITVGTVAKSVFSFFKQK